MAIKNYWRVLARPGNQEGDWNFYSNGWFSHTDGDITTVYKENGYEFISGKISNVIAMSNGYTAIRDEIGEKEEWTVYDKDCVPILTLGCNVNVLRHGMLTYITAQGETRAVTVDKPKDSVSLGYQVTVVRDAPDGVFAYAEKIRNHTYWYLCRLLNGMIVKRQRLSGVRDLFFFDNGSYAAFGKEGMVRVYNSRGQKIFACNQQKTTFCKVGGNYFVAHNGMRYQGVYSAEDGKLVYREDEVEYYFSSGAKYIPNQGLTFDGGKGFITKIHEVVPFTDTLAAFMYKNRWYVINTAMPIENLRRHILEELRALPEGIDFYGSYLANLLTRLYYV